MSTAITIHNVGVKLAGRAVLADVSAEIETGTIVGLLGPSGAGKTTLMRVMSGLQSVVAGSVSVLGKQPGSLAAREQLGYMTQAAAVYPDLTVEENLRYFGALVGASKPRVDETLAEVNLTDQHRQLVGTLSGGQRTRVSLAVALVGQPKVLILDEPTVGLDPVLRAQLWSQFHHLARAGVTLVVSSHVMDEAEHCDGLLLLRDGRVLASGTPAAVMASVKAKRMEEAFLRLVEKRVV